MFIGRNAFTQNAGYIDSNVIFIRARATAGQDPSYTLPSSNTNLYCMGYHFESNIFKNNFGCSQKAGGAIRFECVKEDATMATNNDRYTMPTINLAIVENLCAINTEAAYTEVPMTINSVHYSYSGDLKKITFKNNVYDGNFYTNGKALVHLEGVLRVYFDGDTFTNNGDNTNEALTKFG